MKRKKLYSAEVNQRWGSFTPIIATCKGILDREEESYVNDSLFISQTNGRKITVKQSFGFEPEYRYVFSDLLPTVFEDPEPSGEEGMWKTVLEC